PVYIGLLRYGRMSKGKYSRRDGDVIREKRPDEQQHVRNPASNWIIVDDHHPALIDRQQFERVQARLVGNKKRTTPRVGGGHFVFTRLLVCGRCGSYLLGSTAQGRRRYICGAAMEYGRDHCPAFGVREDAMTDHVVTALERHLNPRRIASLIAEVRR